MRQRNILAPLIVTWLILLGSLGYTSAFTATLLHQSTHAKTDAHSARRGDRS